MFNHRLVSVLTVVPLWGAVAAQLPAATPNPAPATQQPAGGNITASLLQIDLKKSQIQADLANRIVQSRESKLKYLESQQAAGHGNDAAVADAKVDLDQARAAAEVAKLDIAILQVQAKDPAIVNAPATAPQAVSPTERAILGLELQKAQIQAATAAQIAQTRQQQLQILQGKLRGGLTDPAAVSDAQVDADAAQAAAEGAKLDLEALQLRMNSLPPATGR